MSDTSQINKEPIPVIPDAWQIEDGKPHLVGTRCTQCGKAFFPPRKICTYCLTDDTIERAKLGNTGKLYAHTTIRISSKAFNPPYAFGFVVIEPENIRIPTLITGVDDFEALKPGMQMEMVLEKLRDEGEDKELITYKFRPAAA